MCITIVLVEFRDSIPIASVIWEDIGYTLISSIITSLLNVIERLWKIRKRGDSLLIMALIL